MRHLPAWEGYKMIDVTLLNGRQITVNCDLIETIDNVPDTVITLTTGKKIIVKESRQKIVSLVKLYKWGIMNQFCVDETP